MEVLVMASKYNPYFKRLQEDETIQWLRANDPQYSDKHADKGLEYPYLTLKKELYREGVEIAISNVNKSEDRQLMGYLETGNQWEDN